MLKMKYLLATVLVALCAVLSASGAFAANGWTLADQDVPAEMVWEEAAAVEVEAENTGDTWDTDYDLRSVEGVTPTATAVDRWGLTLTPVGGVTPPVAITETELFEFEIVAPPITTLLYVVPARVTAAVDTMECDWMMAELGALIHTDIAANDIVVSRFLDIGSGQWARFYVEECAGRVPFITQGFPDGLYRPGVAVSRDAMAVFIRRAMKIAQVPWADTFGDVPDGFWAAADIEALAASAVVSGYPDGDYHPDWNVGRGQMAAFVARGAGYTVTDPITDPFPDVPVGFWADGEIQACVDNGVVLGYPDGFYRPTAIVSRDQMAVYCFRAFVVSTGSAVVLGGPGLTDVDPATGLGWSGQDTDPTYAYVVFDAARLDDNLDGSGDTDWTVRFDFRDAATPTVAGTTVDVDTSTALIPAAGTYFTVSTSVPALAAGDYVLVVLVEDETGAMVEIARTVAFEDTT